MKVQSGLRFAATALLVSTAGFAIAQSSPHFNAAFAESASIPANLIAQNTPDQDAEGKGQDRKGNMFKELNLTTDQQTKIKAIREQEQGSAKSLRTEMTAAWEKMRSLSAGNATDEELRQQHQQMQQVQQKLGEQRFETMLKIRAVLTPEQRTKMAQLKGQHPGRGHHGSRAHGGEMMMGRQPF
jgi:periplasmic protein CpxP/Spy